MKTPLIIVLASVYGGLSQPLPGWTGPDLNPLMPLGGVPLAANVTLVNVLRATLATGTFNSDPMIDFHDNQLMVSWPMSNGRNGSIGTSILYSQSMDGVNWTATDGSNVLFPALGLFNTSEQLLAAPSLRINGSTYAAATLFSFYLYPDQKPRDLLLRRVYPGIGNLGPMFWISTLPPKGYDNISEQLGIVTINEMDAQTQDDIATLSNFSQLPCDPPSSGNWKCPVCLNGCPTWVIPQYAGEASTYHVSPGGPDVIMYRSQSKTYQLPTAVRSSPTASWSAVGLSDIPDTGSNFDAGNLPDGRPFLLANSMPDIIRDPLFLSTSGDGWNFNATLALTSCSLPVYASADQPTGCLSRFNIDSKEFGCQSPQALVLTAPGFEGFWATYSLNNEDIWVLHAPFSSMP
jgi:hypothetical protein